MTAILLLSCHLSEYVRYPKKYSELVDKYGYEYGVPVHTVYSVIKVESDFNERAVSSKGACGLMQLMPDTYAWICELEGKDTGNIFDPEENVRCGAHLLSILYKRYGDWDVVICAYNAGMGNVDKWLNDGKLDIRFNETENYLRRINAVKQKYDRLYR